MSVKKRRLNDKNISENAISSYVK